MKQALNPLGVMVMVVMLFGVAKADQLAFVTTLTGAQEVPPNASPGIGSALVAKSVASFKQFPNPLRFY